MKKNCVSPIRRHENNFLLLHACRCLLLLLLLLSELCFSWEYRQLIASDEITRGYVQIHYPENQELMVVNVNLYIHPQDMPRFAIDQGQLYIDTFLVTPAWFSAWLTQGAPSGSGVVNVAIYPTIPYTPPPPSTQVTQTFYAPVMTASLFPGIHPLPPSYVPVVPAPIPQPAAVIPFYEAPQQMIQAGNPPMALTPQVNMLPGQPAQPRQDPVEVMTRTEHERSLRKNEAAYKKQLNEKEEKISKLNQRIESLNQSLQGATAPANTELPEEVTSETNYEELLAEKDKTIKEKKEELRCLQQALNDKEELLAQQSQKVLEHDKQLKCLECERDKAKKTAEKAEEEITQEKLKAEKLQSRLSREQSERADETKQHKTTISEEQEQLGSLQAELIQLNTQLTETQKKVRDQQLEIQRIEEAKRSLQEQAKQSADRANDLDSEKKLLDSELKDKEKKLRKEKKNAEVKQSTIEAKKKELEKLKHENQEQRQEADRLRTEKKQQQTNYDKQLEKLKREFDLQAGQNHQQKIEHGIEIEQIRQEHEKEKEHLEAALKISKAVINSVKDTAREKAVPPSESLRSDTVTLPTATTANAENSGTIVIHTNSVVSNTGVSSTTTATVTDPSPINGNEPPVTNDSLTNDQKLMVEGSNERNLPEPKLSENFLIQRNLPPITVGECNPGASDIAGNIDLVDYNPNGEQLPGSDDNKGKRKKGSRRRGERKPSSDQGDNPPDQKSRGQEASSEDVAPSTLNGDAAEVFKLVFQAALPYLLPVVVSIFSAAIAYRLGQGSSRGSGEKSEAGRSHQSSDTEGKDTKVKQVEPVPADTGCDWLGNNKLYPLCLYLLNEPGRDTVTLLVLLHNISVRFPDSLMYPVFFWGYWTASGSLSLDDEELLQRMQSSSPGDPFSVNNVYLHSLRLQDFYREPVARQAIVLRWLVSQWRVKPDAIWNDFAMERSPQQLDKFPVLLGMAFFDRALESEHQKLRQQLEKHQVKALVSKLLTRLLKPNEGAGVSVKEVTLTMFELQKDLPLIFWGQALDTTIEDGREPGLLSGCSKMPISELKQDCFSYIMNRIFWKAKIIGALGKYVTGSLPVIGFSGSGDIKTEYPPVSEQQRITTINFLLNWVDSYYSADSYSEKSGFIRAALVLTGIYNDGTRAIYEQMLQGIRNLRKKKYDLTGRVWTERLQAMKRTSDRSPELTFEPDWRLDDQQNLFLGLTPKVPGEVFPSFSELTDRFKTVILPRNGDTVGYLHSWVPDKRAWSGVNYESGRPVSQGDALGIQCGVIYGIGSSNTKIEMYFAYNQECKLRKTKFNSHLKLPE